MTTITRNRQLPISRGNLPEIQKMERTYFNITIRMPPGSSSDSRHGYRKQGNGKNSITNPNGTSARNKCPNQNGFFTEAVQNRYQHHVRKIPGKPLLHKLRVIHILEADYNLTLKNIFG
jgi:hypothetical protein